MYLIPKRTRRQWLVFNILRRKGKWQWKTWTNIFSLCVKPGSLWLVTCFILVTSCKKKTSYLFCELYFVFVFCLNLFVVVFNLGIWNFDNWIKSVFNSTEHSIINNKFTTVVNLLCIIINYAQYLNTGCLHGNLFSRKLVSDLNIWS